MARTTMMRILEGDFRNSNDIRYILPKKYHPLFGSTLTSAQIYALHLAEVFSVIEFEDAVDGPIKVIVTPWPTKDRITPRSITLRSESELVRRKRE